MSGRRRPGFFVPVVYAAGVVRAAEELGHSRQVLLKAARIPARQLDDPAVKLPLPAYVALLAKGIELEGPGFAYEVGLRGQIAKHGLVGFGAISCATVRDSLNFFARYGAIRTPFYEFSFSETGDVAIVEVREGAVPLGHMRRYAFDTILLEVYSGLKVLLGDPDPPVELWFDYAEPPYYAAYRNRLPKVRFQCQANQARFPASLLKKRLSTADPLTVRQIIGQCEQELMALSQKDNWASRVRERLLDARQPRLGIEAIAQEWGMSSRTLNRYLREQGTGFRILAEDVSHQKACRMLSETMTPVGVIAELLGYSDPAHFARAFRRRAGIVPSAYRRKQQAAGAAPSGRAR